MHTVPVDRWGRLPGVIRDYVIVRDFARDVEAFNRAHRYDYGCRMARTAGSDVSECDTHHAYVSHGVPVILRTSVL